MTFNHTEKNTFCLCYTRRHTRLAMSVGGPSRQKMPPQTLNKSCLVSRVQFGLRVPLFSIKYTGLFQKHAGVSGKYGVLFGLYTSFLKISGIRQEVIIDCPPVIRDNFSFINDCPDFITEFPEGSMVPPAYGIYDRTVEVASNETVSEFKK